MSCSNTHEAEGVDSVKAIVGLSGGPRPLFFVFPLGLDARRSVRAQHRRLAETIFVRAETSREH